MNKYNLSKNSMRNIIFGFILNLLNLLGAFFSRTLLIYILGVEYVGLEGLFSSILMMLNMADLGFGSAIVYKLYKPIAENDTNKVCAFINYYQKIYRCIGTFIFILGILVLPFIDRIVNTSVPIGVNIEVLFLIYLLNASLSYWMFAYKKAILNAHQRNDLESKINSIVVIIRYVLQVFILYTIHDYYVYVIILPIMTFFSNVGNALLVKKYYPQYICKGRLSDEEKGELKSKIIALFYNKLGVTLINGSDNIIISLFLGLTMSGIYSSYYYIFNMLHKFFEVMHTAVTGGIGNRIVTESTDKNYELFKLINFGNLWLVGWCSICLCCLYKPFIMIWIGKSKALTAWFSLLMAIYFYFWMIRFVVIIFKNAQGLWWDDRFRATIEGVFNLVLNIFLVIKIGIYGIVVSTILAMIIVSIPWETKVLFKNYFNKSTKEYYLTMIKMTLITIVMGLFTYSLCKMIEDKGIISFLIKLLICIVVPNVCEGILCYRNEQFKKIRIWIFQESKTKKKNLSL
ncbi:MAG: oligosaccharide flippase family protein [Dorea sp.]|nr:oligosaccharide flippase family protein [Dorea sp.]